MTPHSEFRRAVAMAVRRCTLAFVPASRVAWVGLNAALILLHEKIDLLRETQWSALLELQQEQLKLLQALATPPR